MPESALSASLRIVRILRDEMRDAAEDKEDLVLTPEDCSEQVGELDEVIEFLEGLQAKAEGKKAVVGAVVETLARDEENAA